MPRFALVMREDNDAWARLAEGERERFMGLYLAWIHELVGRGAFKGGEAFGCGGRLLEPGGDGVVERVFLTRVQVATGIFFVEAPDLAAAVEIARGCPALLHGETIEVRPIGHD